MKNYLIPAVILFSCAIICTKVFFTNSETKTQIRAYKKSKEQKRTKELLESHARSEIDFLIKKYDIEILQDQLNKKRLMEEHPPYVHTK